MKFGVREICDVTFKSTDTRKIGNKTFKAGQPVFMIDTATTSELSQESTTVYAQGGKGYNRLIAWEGEKTMTFTVTDALMSPMGLAVLSGAGLIKANENNVAHVHVTYDVQLDEAGKGEITLADLQEELGLADAETFAICTDVPMYATVLDGSGAGIDWVDASEVEFTDADDHLIDVDEETPFEFTIATQVGQVVKLDFYVAMANGVTTVQIKPEDFGGYFYVEADTLFRREDTGKDMAASIVFPRVKVQSGFTFTMAATGDPSTFDFTMDAFPGYTYFDRTKKVCCEIQIVGVDKNTKEEVIGHKADHTPSKHAHVVAEEEPIEP